MNIGRNTLINLVGGVVLIAMSIITVPIYLRLIGEARYGVVSLIWLIVGYFGLVDLGLGTATTNALAKSQDELRSRQLFWTALILNTVLGVTGAGVCFIIGEVLLGRVLTLPAPLNGEVMAALPWIAAGIPFLTINGVFTGTLVARHRFLTLNVANTAGWTLFQLLPLVAVFAFGPTLQVLIAAATCSRAVNMLVYGTLAFRALPAGGPTFVSAELPSLFRYGGWVLITNLVSPILDSVDRFIVGSMMGAAAVAQYTVPFSLTMRARMVPGALIQTLFPVLSGQPREQANNLAERSVRTLSVIMTGLCAPAIVLARPFFHFWIGGAFGDRAAPVAELLLPGVWISSLAFVPSSLLAAVGRPAVVARFHVLELVPFLGILALGVLWLGLPGAALAWTLRIALDAGLLFNASGIGRRRLAPILIGALIMAVAFAISRLQPPLLVAVPIATLLGCATVAWGWSSDPELRSFVRRNQALLPFGRASEG